MPDSRIATAQEKHKHPCTIRPACEQDVSVVLGLIRELAEYEHALRDFNATEQSLHEALTRGSLKVLLVSPGLDATTHRKTEDLEHGTENSEEIAGMALFFHNYSSWTSRPGIFLEDLFVRQQHRGRGYGTALLSAIAVEVIELGGARLEWTVPRWNETSIRFYESKVIGAKMLEERVWMRVDGLELKRLAEKSAERQKDNDEDRSVE